MIFIDTVEDFLIKQAFLYDFLKDQMQVNAISFNTGDLIFRCLQPDLKERITW